MHKFSGSSTNNDYTSQRWVYRIKITFGKTYIAEFKNEIF